MMAKAKKRMKAPKGRTEVLREAWGVAVERLSAAEAQVEKQVQRIMKRSKIDPREAKSMLAYLGTRLDRERRKATKDVEARLKTLQARVKKERKAATKLVHEGVQQALAALNIPSRREVSELTGKVEELSRKIDALRRRK
jgi:polyhydroxyalkanoate synthesis regulator phasin